MSKTVTMKSARGQAPASPAKAQYDSKGNLVRPRTLTTPFREWAREEYRNHGNLSAKLARVVNGGGR